MQCSAVDRRMEQQRIQFHVVLHVGFLFALFDFVQRRLRDVNVAALDEDRHLSIEEREQQSAYVTSVNIRVTHQKNPVIAQLVDIEVIAPDAATQGGDQR